MKKSQQGFIIPLLIAIIAILAAGGGGYAYIKKTKKSQEISPTIKISETQNSSNTVTMPKSIQVETAEKTITTPKSVQTSTEDKKVTTQSTVQTKKTIDTGVAKINVDISADVTTTVSCGDEGCFDKKFTTCQPATMTSDVGFGAIYYKIIGPKTNGCQMTMKYLKNPNPQWENKEMICTFDNKLSLQASIEKTMNGILSGSVVCEGPLYTILHAMVPAN